MQAVRVLRGGLAFTDAVKQTGECGLFDRTVIIFFSMKYKLGKSLYIFIEGSCCIIFSVERIGIYE